MLERVRSWTNRKRLALILTTMLLAIVGSAAAYYVFFENGSGQTTPTTIGTVQNDGKELALSGTVTSTVSGPGSGAPVTLKVVNNSGTTQEIAKVTAVPVVGEPYAKNGCKAEWFAGEEKGTSEIYTGAGRSTALNIPTGESTLPSGLQLHFNNEEANQGACSGASVTVELHSTP